MFFCFLITDSFLVEFKKRIICRDFFQNVGVFFCFFLYGKSILFINTHLKAVGAVPPVKLKDGREFGSKAIAGEGEGALKVKLPAGAAGGCACGVKRLLQHENLCFILFIVRNQLVRISGKNIQHLR